ncbi:MAG: alkaline phosphatase [Clostridium sp.]|nr:alkaline phosphatase [Clostridium sp.]
MKLTGFFTAAAAALLAVAPFEADAQAKYVFYFIGDGMGMGHVNAAETYNRDVLRSTDPILMMTFPVASQVRTFSANRPITDSAAAGTALSTGSKTNNYTIGMAPDSTDLRSIAADFVRAGYAVGVASTVPGDDATPAAFYAHAWNRGMNDLIAPQATGSGFRFLGAPMFRGQSDGWIAEMERNGYTVVYDYENYTSLPETPAKTLMLSSKPFGQQAGYTIDSIPGAVTAEQLTRACLRQLEATDAPGFFMMIEGGNIDWAAHSNDGGAVIKEVLNYQKAIDVAYQFYLAHPDETLIVVTADHDTGGMALGRLENGQPDLSLADFQRISKERFSGYWRERLEKGDKVTWKEMQRFLKENLGFWGVTKISDSETAELKEAFESTFVRRDGVEEKTLYSNFDMFTVRVFDIFNIRLGIGWTTTNHTGNFVPLYAVGVDADLFRQNLNNTSIPRLILRAAALGR